MKVASPKQFTIQAKTKNRSSSLVSLTWRRSFARDDGKVSRAGLFVNPQLMPAALFGVEFLLRNTTQNVRMRQPTGVFRSTPHSLLW
jgi:hypothetical protein